MPSGLNQILPRMRVSSDALRISALVAVGVTTGYFWRAAFEASPSGHPVSAPVNIVEPTPKPPVHSTVKPKPVVPTPHTAPSPVLISSGPQPFVVQTPAPSVRPTPPHKPTPRPPVPTSPPPAPSPQPGTPTPPVTTPTTPAPTTPASPAKGPVAATPPPPVVTQPPPQPPPPTTGNDGDDHDNGHHGKGGNDGSDKPGWGHGDENHDHSGPKGHGG